MKSKQTMIIIISALLIITVAATATAKYFNEQNKEKTDAIKFKEEYEKVNGQDVVGNENKTYKTLTIDKNNPIEYADYDKVFEILEGSGVIYFGFPECPWCRNALPVLLDAAKEAGIDKIYYMNNYEDRDIKTLEDNEVITTKEGSEKYYQLLDKLGAEFTREYSGLNDSSIRRLYYPTVIFVQNGKIIKSHVATLESQTDPYIALTEEQTEELKNIYVEAMTQTTLCNQSC